MARVRYKEEYEDTSEKKVRSAGRPAHRKQRRGRKINVKVVLAIPGGLLLLALVILLGFRVKQVDISGNKLVSEDEIKQVIQYDACYGNSLLLWIMNRSVDLSANDMLVAVNVSLKNPMTVSVRVEEQSLAGCIKIGSQYYFINDHGMVIACQTQMMAGVPEITGLAIENAQVGDYLTAADESQMKDLIDIAADVTFYSVTVDSIAPSENGTYSLLMGKITVLLGRDIYMDEKISEVKDLEVELQNMSGTLHLEDYDTTKDSIIFTKDS